MKNKKEKKIRRLHTAQANTEDELPLSKRIQKLSKIIKQGFLNDYIMQNFPNWNPLMKAKLGGNILEQNSFFVFNRIKYELSSHNYSISYIKK